jgi:hypothetical protein
MRLTFSTGAGIIFFVSSISFCILRMVSTRSESWKSIKYFFNTGNETAAPKIAGLGNSATNSPTTVESICCAAVGE